VRYATSGEADAFKGSTSRLVKRIGAKYHWVHFRYVAGPRGIGPKRHGCPKRPHGGLRSGSRVMLLCYGPPFRSMTTEIGRAALEILVVPLIARLGLASAVRGRCVLTCQPPTRRREEAR
jgi:hypothetical protein